MSKNTVNYDSISSTYNQRYKASGLEGVTSALQNIISYNSFDYILEVGCGTCKWLNDIQNSGSKLCGLDPSLGMLKEAQSNSPEIHLFSGKANTLPFKPNTFDFIFSVNSFHFFDDKPAFILSARELLRSKGVLSIVNIDPRKIGINNWFMYQYFDRTFELDLQRFPAWEQTAEWMKMAGFINVEIQIVHKLEDDKIGEGIYSDNFIQKDQASQLALLSQEEYEYGIEKIKNTVSDSIKNKEEIIFPVRLDFAMVTGRKE